MNVCVTGGNGFIGKNLIHKLLSKNYKVCMLTRNTHKDIPKGVRIVTGDLTSGKCPLADFVSGCDIIFHCAGEIHNDEVMKALHVDGTQRLIDAVKKEASTSDKEIHWIQLSSVGAYGPPLEGANVVRTVTETSALHPKDLYEKTKLRSDELVAKASQNSNFTYTIVRPSIVFGKEMPNQSLTQLIRMVKKGMFFYIGKADAIAPYVHVDDVVDLLICCSETVAAKYEVFNISNDCMLKDLINEIADYSSVRRPWLRLPEKVVRIFVNIVNKLVKLPLTQSRIDALVSRTRYPTTKIEKYLDFYPQRQPQIYIREILKF